jgi:hypothetical protein
MAVPVIALPGDLESIPAETAALAALAARGIPVLDGRLVRWIELPDVTIGTVAGSAQLVAGADGCSWHPADVRALYAELAARPGLRIAALAEAPREVVDGSPEGDAALGPEPTTAIDLILHGPSHPAPSPTRVGGRDGARVALSPGTADASPRLPTSPVPSAGVLVIRGASWSWTPVLDQP